MTFSPSSAVCVRTAPNPSLQAPVCKINRREKSGQASTGVVDSAVFIFSKAYCCSGPHDHRTFFLVNLINGSVRRAKPFTKRRYQEARPINLRICRMFCGNLAHSCGILAWLALSRDRCVYHCGRLGGPNILIVVRRIYIFLC